VRLSLDIKGVGTVDAVADLPGRGSTAPAVGTDVPVVVDLTRTAPLRGSEAAGGCP